MKSFRKQPLVHFFSSLKLTVICLVLLMVLVFVATLAQIDMGIYFAKKTYFQSLFVYWNATESIKIPIFPGGMLLGWLLLINLITAHFTRFKWSFKKAGIWLTHVGLILLIIGSGLSSYLAEESQMAIQEGSSKNYATSSQEVELVAISESSATQEQVVSIPQSRLKASDTLIQTPELPFSFRILKVFNNSKLGMATGSNITPLATQGIGSQIVVSSLSLDKQEAGNNTFSAYVELFKDSKSLGIWLLSSGLGAPQTITVGPKTYTLSIRHKRLYAPYSITLLKFKHDVYPGTNIPKNFSSHVRVNNPTTHETRDFLIYMNNPLRYQGNTYYQASFGNNDTMSVLQVVKNPGWIFPYVSCGLMFLGLLIHFMMSLIFRTRSKQSN